MSERFPGWDTYKPIPKDELIAKMRKAAKETKFTSLAVKPKKRSKKSK